MHVISSRPSDGVLANCEYKTTLLGILEIPLGMTLRNLPHNGLYCAAGCSDAFCTT